MATQQKFDKQADFEAIDAIRKTLAARIKDMSFVDVSNPPELKRRGRQTVSAVTVTCQGDRSALQLEVETPADAEAFKRTVAAFCKMLDEPAELSPYILPEREAAVCRALRTTPYVYLVKHPDLKAA